MHRYLYRKLRDYLDLYIRPEDRVVEIDAKGMSDSLRFPNKVLFVLKSGNGESWAKTADLGRVRESLPEWVLLNGNIHYEEDLQSFLEELRQILAPSSKVILTYYSSLWKPLLRLATSLGIRGATPELSALLDRMGGAKMMRF